MYEVECAYRRDGGALKFIRECRMDETTDDFCKLRVTFRVDEIYPADPDTGVGMDWNGGIDSIEIRNFVGWTRWRVLRGDELETARRFLEEEYAEEMLQAEGDYAEAVHYGEVA